MSHVLADIEPRLRWLLPAELYAAVWLTPSRETLSQVFEHLRTLLISVRSYLPQQVIEHPPILGHTQYKWQEGTLMFTDLAGFTPMMETKAALGRAGAQVLLGKLNDYFTEMILIITKAGGTLLEFTGDALLAQFPQDRRRNSTLRAIHAGLRMQREMNPSDQDRKTQSKIGLGMRVGIHSGQFMSADIGTPRRMSHVLLGKAVHQTKLVESAGQVGRVCLTTNAHHHMLEAFQFEPNHNNTMFVVDDLSKEQLGEFDLVPQRRRLAMPLLLDRSIEGLVQEINMAVTLIEPLASYLPMPILNLLVENASQRMIPPDFFPATVLFVNLIGLAETIDDLESGQETILIDHFAHIFSLINATIEERGGMLKSVTYHLIGSDMMIYFGPPTGHSDDPVRAVNTALEIRQIIRQFTALELKCRMGLAYGTVFAAEIGDPRGRREFNILGDTVNTAARLMGKAQDDQILLDHSVYQKINHLFNCQSLGEIALKGKDNLMPTFSLGFERE